jgi:hypothetical protein
LPRYPQFCKDGLLVYDEPKRSFWRKDIFSASKKRAWIRALDEVKIATEMSSLKKFRIIDQELRVCKYGSSLLVLFERGTELVLCRLETLVQQIRTFCEDDILRHYFARDRMFATKWSDFLPKFRYSWTICETRIQPGRNKITVQMHCIPMHHSTHPANQVR